VDFVLDSQWVVDSFHADIDNHSEFGCIINVVDSSFKIAFKTLMSYLIGDKQMR